MVMVAARAGGLEAGDSVADVDALHEPELGEHVEHAVDGRDPDRALARAGSRGSPARSRSSLPASRSITAARAPRRESRPRAEPARCAHASSRQQPSRKMIPVLIDVLWWPRVKTRIVLTLTLPSRRSPAAAATRARDGQPTVVAAFYPLAFAAQQIGGAGIDVRNLTPPGAEPHDLELSGSDVRTIADADLVLYLGEGFMPALEDAVDSTSAHAVDLLDASTLARRGDEPASILTSGSIRSGTPRSRADRQGARPPPEAERFAAQAARARPRVPPRPRPLRAARDRHEPRGVRLSRRALRPRAGPAHGLAPGGGAVARATWRSSCARCAQSGRRRSSSRRSSRRSSPRRSRARPARRPPCSTRSRA